MTLPHRPRGRAAVVVALCLVAAGWRGDGSGVGGPAPAADAWGHQVWRVASRSGNGTPVVVGADVCFTAEPTSVVCVDRASGHERWRASHEVIDTMPTAAADELRERLSQAPGLQAELDQRTRAYSLSMRAMRSGSSNVTGADLQAAQAQIGTLRAQLDGIAPYRTEDTHDEIGWASPSPATDGRALFVLFANGVVARHEASGAQAWVRWLGPPILDKLGYRGTDSASLVFAGGLLIVPYRNLTAIDPRDGHVVWSGPKYAQYGTPAVARVGDRDVVVTPDGQAIDARTGEVLVTGLGRLGYTGAHAVGDRVWFVGSDAAYDSVDPNQGRGWRLVADGAKLSAQPLWDVQLASRDRIYGPPVLWGERLYVVTHNKQLLVLDAATGAVVHERALSTAVGEVWAAPLLADGHLYITTLQGTVIELDAAPPFAGIAERRLPKGRGVMVFDRASILWNAADGLYRFGTP